MLKSFGIFESAMRIEAGFRFGELPEKYKLLLFKEILKLGTAMEPGMSKSQLEMDLQLPKRYKAYVLEALEHLYTTSPAGLYTGNEEGMLLCL